MVIGRIFGDWFRDKLGVYLIIMILFLFTNISLIILIYFNSVLSSIIGFSLLGLGTSLVVPIAYSLAGKIKGIDSGVAISIISIFVSYFCLCSLLTYILDFLCHVFFLSFWR